MRRFWRKMRTFPILVSVLAGAFIPLSAASAKTQALCVNPGGTAGCEATISDAVAKITEKTVTITVAAGIYDDNVSINTGIKPKTLIMTITGSAGASSTVIDGKAAGAVFMIGSKAKVTLTGLTITNGTGGPAQGETGGGGILATGATVTVNACVIDDNKAALGAGIYGVDGNLTVTSSSITGNLGQASHVSEGGGIYFSSSSKSHKLTIDRSTIDSNSATFGGGVLLSDSGPPIKLSATISDSTISNNTSATSAFGPGSGAGLDIGFAKLTMINSTISGNNASGTTATGGAIQTFAAAVTLNNVTIANNSAGSIGGGINANINDQSFVISNTIIADNNAPASVDCEGPITSDDYNFIGDPSGCTLSNKTAHNLSGDPMLAPLKNNGGATDTRALLPGSPALGAGNPGVLNGKSGHCAAADQIGTGRSKGDCDIGAYQLPD